MVNVTNNVDLNTFPSNKTQALTMLYLQNQDLTGKSPSEIVDLYISVTEEIKEAFRNNGGPKASVKSF
ncbi:hypothetical protein [Bacillus pseudomycoides]|uniref:hypothetical protein n=1 Tax=Bacillus pseudomycoides TaxID=64104 RepID=UPI000BEE2FAC|nr:hypothetical protein [Bacillus pseudomycoides]PED05266.1 hypothetical protein COO19_27430 [Bacillus pseudomycoides]PEK14721.1 hypothetical protein CN693_23600 [Bacillus pseudomycoides]PEO23184.1 hypothetical protein CN542_02760 [Bacillus pseudomycoides]PEP58505.1 hypothetical protein CN591_22810 [Bacillus pseudomycoides]PFW69773.1 hypothetical protein COL25_06700 [Bacillus pseudomycoides]